MIASARLSRGSARRGGIDPSATGPGSARWLRGGLAGRRRPWPGLQRRRQSTPTTVPALSSPPRRSRRSPPCPARRRDCDPGLRSIPLVPRHSSACSLRASRSCVSSRRSDSDGTSASGVPRRGRAPHRAVRVPAPRHPLATRRRRPGTGGAAPVHGTQRHCGTCPPGRTMARSCLYLLDENQKIKEERHTFYILPREQE